MESTSTEKRLVKVGTTAEFSAGRGHEVIVEGRKLALFKINSGYYAVLNQCLHRGGPLSEGELNDYKATCPWHGWKYDVRNGSFDIIPTLKIKPFPVTEKDGSLYVEID